MLANLISLSRIPLAFLMIVPSFRLVAIALACLSDMIDGSIARWMNQQSKFGTYLDPFCDKFFVISGLALFMSEGLLTPFQVICFVSREITLALFVIILLYQGKFKQYIVRPFILGKLITSLQFVAFALLALNSTIPTIIDQLFITFSFFSFFELVVRDRKVAKSIRS